MKGEPISESTAYAILDSCRHLVSLIHSSSRASERDLGLSAAQLYVLQKLSALPGRSSVNELAALTRTHQSSVSAVVKKLLEKKLLTGKASAKDARRLELAVTAKGRKLLAASPEAVQDKLIRAIKTLPAADGLVLQGLLEHVLSKAAAPARRASLFFEDSISD